jgi:Flp pilus assembly protein TadD
MLFLPWLILIGVVAGCWKSRRAWGKDVLLGLGFFLITIAPFLGFTQGAYMSFTWVMDHLLYIPLIGLIGLAVAGCEQIEAKLSKEACVPAVGAVVLSMLFLAFESHGYAAVFRNQEQLWSYTLQGNPDSDVAHNNLGLVYLNSNRLPLAIEQFDEALRLNSTYSYAHNGLGNALFESGRTAEAIDHYHEALKIDPEYPEAHNGLGNALLATGHLDEAQKEFAESLKLNPHYVDAHCNLGLIYAQQGRVAEAIAEFETAEKLSPADPRIEQELELLRNQQKATGK